MHRRPYVLSKHKAPFYLVHLLLIHYDMHTNNFTRGKLRACFFSFDLKRLFSIRFLYSEIPFCYKTSFTHDE